MGKCNCVYEPFCSMLNGSDIILPTPCEYHKASTNFVEVVHGRWEARGFYGHNCSVCGALNDIDTNYCPNCGARMDGEG